MSEREVELTSEEREALRQAANGAMAPMTCGGHNSMGSLIRCQECLDRQNAATDLSRALTPSAVLALLDVAARLADAKARAEAVSAAAQVAVDKYFEWRLNMHSIEAHKYGGYRVRQSEHDARRAMDALREALRGDQ